MKSRKVGVALLTAGMALGCTNVAIVGSPETKENQVIFDNPKEISVDQPT